MDKKIWLLILVVLSITLSGCVQTPPPTNFFTYYNGTLQTNNSLVLNNIQITTPVYENLRFPTSTIRTQGVSNIPEETIYGYAFDDNIEEYLFIIAQMPHTRTVDSDLLAHWQWHSDSDSAGDVVWCIEYQWTNIDEALISQKETECSVDSSVLDADIFLMSDNSILNGTGKYASSIITASIYRNASDSRDTYTGDAILLAFDLNYQINRFGDIDIS